jgi:hypothetical protein
MGSKNPVRDHESEATERDKINFKENCPTKAPG